MSEVKAISPEISIPEIIKAILHKELDSIGTFEECALLDYPNHLNIGDSMIWLGELFYLTDVLKVKIKYVATAEDFSAVEMEKKIGKSPILLHGGGNLGDLWPNYQRFREKIISRYQDRQIVILPQSIYFARTENLEIAANLFNSHPNLTICVRENYSYEIGTKYFYKCRIIKAPDMAFQMVGMPWLSFNSNPKSGILYQNRHDLELNQNFSLGYINIQDLIVEDWVSYKWIYREQLKNTEVLYWRIPGMVKLIREGWQRCLANPSEWLSRTRWERFHPYITKFDGIDRRELHKKSWSLIHSGVFQFNNYRVIITNRLHGHILCLLLGKPHVFLPNNYYKNESFYETWTSQIPFCRFVKEPGKIQEAVQELMELFNDSCD